MISVVSAAKYYGREVALFDVSFDICSGQSVALTGVNGAGKTTLIRILSGVERADAGEISLLGVPLNEIYGYRGVAVRSQIGVAIGPSFFYGQLSLLENLRFYAHLYRLTDPNSRVDAALASFELEPHASKEVRHLSLGLAKRATLARAMMHQPNLLLLDEPFSHLDERGKELLIALLSEYQGHARCILFSSHDAEHIQLLATHRLELRNRGVYSFDSVGGDRKRRAYEG